MVAWGRNNEDYDTKIGEVERGLKYYVCFQVVPSIFDLYACIKYKFYIFGKIVDLINKLSSIVFSM